MWNGQLADPGAVLRWIIAAALVAGLAALRRRGLSLLSRQALAIWVLAALLHGPALGNDHDAFATPALPESVVTLVQTLAAVSAMGLVLFGLVSLAPWPAPVAAAPALMPAHGWAAARSALRISGLLSRPPPRQ